MWREFGILTTTNFVINFFHGYVLTPPPPPTPSSERQCSVQYFKYMSKKHLHYT